MNDATYELLFDNAFGLTEGGDFKVAGVRAGKITTLDVDQKTQRAVIGFKVTETGGSGVREVVICCGYLGEQIEERDRDDLLLEVYAQLGEIYLVRTAYNGVEECLRRITDCLAIYQSIRAGMRSPSACNCADAAPLALTSSVHQVNHSVRSAGSVGRTTSRSERCDSLRNADMS